ncbi:MULTISPECIES: hemerythrin domain-containing protein [Amycolatopsis]|uniref:Hemerythrin HHE cation binding domain-containing protein n=1 Tax=Amycolatopsis echigonensis TaxID=2576905 RepID=A0A2N3X1D2_9PSEU|nr:MULTISPECIES: hemerythrin domain-containing protein [Amycolatopsis]PKV99904.1 hemerythrin HHE cation binding domain-containing protein [Amycolatopsis niigatensis]
MTGTNVPTRRDANVEADTDAALLAIRAHHAALDHDLGNRVADVLAVVGQRHSPAGVPAIVGDTLTAWRALLTFLLDELLPHAAAEERTLYPAAAEDPHTAALVQAMVDEHRTLTELVGELKNVTDPLALATTATAVRILFTIHVHKENEYLLPALHRSGTDIAALLSSTHRLLTGGQHNDNPGDHRDEH